MKFKIIMNEHMHNQSENKKSLEQYWQESQAIFSQINDIGLASYMESVPNLCDAFKLSDKSVRCIDEGTPGGIHIAGSAILLSTEDKKAELEKVIEELRGAGADGVYSHEGCGAAKLYLNSLPEDQRGEKSYTEHAIDWAKKLAEILSVPYKGHITDLKRPKEFHNARIAYFDGSGKFDPFKIKEIPDGFIISRYYLDPEYAKAELGVALSIAMGDHGFGEKFTKENPFIIAPIEKFKTKREGISMEDMMRDAEEIARQYGDRVIVRGFREPEQI
jgi:hypothetical protein